MLPADAGHSKQSPFRVVLVSEDEVCDFCDGPGIIQIPSTLNTGMGLDSFRVVRRCVRTYSRSMKFPVAPESTRELTDLTSAVSVVSMLTFSFKDLGSFSAEATTSFSRRARSQRGRNCHASSDFGTSLIGSTGSSISGMLSTGKMENWLCADDEGVLFTRRLWENPLLQALPG